MNPRPLCEEERKTLTSAVPWCSCEKSALAAESVGVEVALIPHIKARIGQYLTLKKHHILLNDLDRVLGVRHHLRPDHA